MTSSYPWPDEILCLMGDFFHMVNLAHGFGVSRVRTPLKFCQSSLPELNIELDLPP